MNPQYPALMRRNLDEAFYPDLVKQALLAAILGRILAGVGNVRSCSRVPSPITRLMGTRLGLVLRLIVLLAVVLLVFPRLIPIHAHALALLCGRISLRSLLGLDRHRMTDTPGPGW